MTSGRICDRIAKYAVPHAAGWTRSQDGRGQVLITPLLAHEKEGSVPVLENMRYDDRSPQIKTENVLPQSRHVWRKEVACVKHVIAQELPRGAMESAGTALRLHQESVSTHEVVLYAVVVL